MINTKHSDPPDGLLFRIDVIMNEGVSVLNWHLHDSLDEEVPYEFKFKPGGAKVEVILKKAKNTHWTSFGTPGMFFEAIRNICNEGLSVCPAIRRSVIRAFLKDTGAFELVSCESGVRKCSCRGGAFCSEPLGAQTLSLSF